MTPELVERGGRLIVRAPFNPARGRRGGAEGRRRDPRLLAAAGRAA